MPDAAPSTGPLNGVRIVDLSTVLLGPYATQILGDLGADVVKVETGGGDIMRHAGPAPAEGMGALFMASNRNKRSIVLDLKTQLGAEALRRLIQRSDVFFTNVRMDGLKRLGFGPEEVRVLRPDGLYVHCAGYGSNGPMAGSPAYDDLIQAGSGVAQLYSIRHGGPPQYVPSLVADKATGLHAAYATLAGLFHRQRTGEGQFIEVPMLEAFTSFTLLENLYGHTYVPPLTHVAYSRSVSANRRPYATLDGYIGVLPYSDEQWETFFALGGRPGVMTEDPRFSTYKARTANIDALYALVAETVATKTTEDWLNLLREADIPALRCNSLEDVLVDPHLRATGLIHEREHPAFGPYVAVGPPIRFEATPSDIRREPPRLGEHTGEILAELGLGAGA